VLLLQLYDLCCRLAAYSYSEGEVLEWFSHFAGSIVERIDGSETNVCVAAHAEQIVDRILYEVTVAMPCSCTNSGSYHHE